MTTTSALPLSVRQQEFLAAKNQSAQLYEAVAAASTALNAFLSGFPRGQMNLTPDHVKAMPEYQRLGKAYDSAFAELRRFNTTYLKTFAKEIRADRKARFSRQANAAA